MGKKSELMPGTLGLMILRTLRDGPMHGYGIAQSIHARSLRVLQIEEGSLYPALQRLLLRGWVTGRWGESENHRRARYYQLTPAGWRALELEGAAFERVTKAIRRVVRPAEG